MNKRILLLSFVLLITFSGGFFTGIFFSNHNDQRKPLNTNEAPLSAKKPELKQTPKWKKDQPKKLIGYVQDFRDPDVVDYSKLTHVIFSFAHPTKDGRILLNGDQAHNNLRTIVAKAQKYDTKVMLAVGGWYHIHGGESYEYFKTAIANPESRLKLVNELAGFAEREKLDGIDIDFEHPRSSVDAQNLTTFIKELNDRLQPIEKDLSIAVHAKIHSVTGTEAQFVIYEPSMFQHVDHVNIMAYDGQWDGGYNAANLSPYPFTEKIVNYWTNLFDKHKLSREKLILGVPSYAQPEDPNIKQVSYAAIVNNNQVNRESDTIIMNGTTYHYNGEATMIKKTKLALEHGFGGMMMWEAGHDAQGSNSLTSSIFEALDQSS